MVKSRESGVSNHVAPHANPKDPPSFVIATPHG
jgi:hypothetical protein